VKVKAGNSNVRETTKTESSFDLLPFGDFIALLKSEGFIIDLKDFAEFTRVFESFSEDTKLFSHSLPEEENDDPRRKLKYYLAPLVCRNETEQKKFYQSFDNFFITKQGGVVSAQATTAEKKKWWKNRLLLMALGCVVLGVAVWYLTRPPQPVNPPILPAVRIIVKTSPDSLWTNYPILFGYESADSMVNSSSKETTAEWRFSNDTITIQKEPTHIFNRCGTYTASLVVKDATGRIIGSNSDTIHISPSLQLVNFNGTDFFENDTVIITASSVDSLYSRTSTSWVVTNTTSGNTDTLVRNSTNRLEYIPKDTGIFTVSLFTDSAVCTSNATATFNVSGRNNFFLAIQPSDPIEQHFSFSPYWIWSFIILILTGLALTYYFFRKENKHKTLAGVDEKEFSGMEAPFEVPFLSKNNKIVKLQKQSAFSSLLLQRTESDVTYLDVSRTLKSTINNFGFLIPEYARRQKDRDYLVLIDTSNTSGKQYFNLFTYLVKTFVSDNVNLSYYFYNGNPNKIYRQGSNSFQNLSALKDKHYGSNLILFTNGYTLLSNVIPDVSNNVKDEFSFWNKRIVVTPISANDWDGNERILSSFFNIVPADVQGLIELIKFINEDLPGNSSFKKIDWKTYSSKLVNVGDIGPLKEYINDADVFQWLCGIAVYHQIRWEVLIEIGKNILASGNAAAKLNYSNLLKIARIKWMEEGSFPGSLRLSLLKELTTENEIIARRTMLSLMSESDKLIDVHSFSYEEKMVQRYTDSFVLYANDHVKNDPYKNDAEKFMGLWKENAIADMTLRSYLQNPNHQWKTPINSLTGDTHNINADEFIRQAIKPPSPISAYLSSAITIVIFILFLLSKFLDKDFYQSRFNKWLNIVTMQYPNKFDIGVLLDNNECRRIFGDSTDGQRVYLTENINSRNTILDSAVVKTPLQTDTVIRVDSLFRNMKIKTLPARRISLSVKSGQSTISLPLASDTIYKTYRLSVSGIGCDIADTVNVLLSYDSANKSAALAGFPRIASAQNFIISSARPDKKDVASTVFYYDDSKKNRALQLAALASQTFGQPVSISRSIPSNRDQMELWIGQVPCADISPSALTSLVQGSWYFNSDMKYGVLLEKDAFFIFNEKYSNKIHPPYDPLNFQSHQIKRIQQCGSKYVIDCVPQRNNPDIPSSTTVSLSMITPEKLQVIESGSMNGNYQLLFDLTNYTSYKTSDPRDIGVWHPSQQFESEELTIETRLITTNTKKNHSGSASDSFDIKSVYKDKNNNRIYVISGVGSKSSESMTAVIIIDRSKGKYFNSWDVSGNRFDLRKFKMNDIAFDYANFQKLSRRLDTVSTINVATSPPKPQFKPVPGMRPDSARKKILWVDDHPENNKAIITDLENEGLKTTIALSNLEARNLLNDRSISYDLIITDIGRDNKENAPNQSIQNNTDGIAFIRSLAPDQIKNVVVYTLDSNISTYRSELMKMGVINVISNADELKRIIFQKFKINKAKY